MITINPSIFQLDYEKMQRNNEEMYERLIKKSYETFKGLQKS